ncbi:MAG: hypothetical protein KY455_02310 [Euryarchaeota archaeon]|nr:hypothetical protein [Euryarchaeota archaeon]
MPLSLDDPLLWGIVFLVLLVLEILIAANVRAHRTAAQKRAYAPTTAAPSLAPEEDLTEILSRFAEDEKGHRIGETVGMDGDLLILKEGKTYRAIPYDAFRREGETLILVRPVDLVAAEKRGEEWRERQHRVVTYSEEEVPKDDED